MPISAKKTTGGHGKMDMITRMIVKVREYQRGQTMTEYALILAAVAVVVYVGYQTMGSDIGSLLGRVDSQL
jgi:Flp pilus assembly pilin Flp